MLICVLSHTRQRPPRTRDARFSWARQPRATEKGILNKRAGGPRSAVAVWPGEGASPGSCLLRCGGSGVPSIPPLCATPCDSQGASHVSSPGPSRSPRPARPGAHRLAFLRLPRPLPTRGGRPGPGRGESGCRNRPCRSGCHLTTASAQSRAGFGWKPPPAAAAGAGAGGAGCGVGGSPPLPAACPPLPGLRSQPQGRRVRVAYGAGPLARRTCLTRGADGARAGPRTADPCVSSRLSQRTPGPRRREVWAQRVPASTNSAGPNQQGGDLLPSPWQACVPEATSGWESAGRGGCGERRARHLVLSRSPRPTQQIPAGAAPTPRVPEKRPRPPAPSGSRCPGLTFPGTCWGSGCAAGVAEA